MLPMLPSLLIASAEIVLQMFLAVPIRAGVAGDPKLRVSYAKKLSCAFFAHMYYSCCNHDTRGTPISREVASTTRAPAFEVAVLELAVLVLLVV